MANRFRKKPVVIEAIHFDGSSESASQIYNWVAPHQPISLRNLDGVKTIVINTLEGEMTAQVGDWIIRGVAGEFYPCKPNIFEQTYESVR
jgi:hypothetical protein